ncbi:glycosyltransferase [Pseudoduganella sp. FT55W]|uniref:Glycosyltransferase n=1 Tax=Duganella rivi TaxID=2666083 RepID=A0A7X4KFE8_9BURK|nr:glycosyltransferase [Duganella rivi]MYM70403.1 glycosyltransferase [Duganella rivi]
MDNPRILLSICIPTFNRGALLRNTLESIVTQAEFAEGEAEVVISDNCSTDDTEALVAPFVQAYPGKVIYHRHPEPIWADSNFEAVLKMGRGAFMKLHNDNLMLMNGALGELLKVVRVTEAEKPVIFVTNGTMNAGNPIEALASMNDFVRRVSFISTWIGGFGIWREQFEAMPDFARYAKLKLVQTDVVLRLLAQGRRAIVLYQPYFAIQGVGRKGGYNIAEVFGQNYLYILKAHLLTGMLDKDVYEAEKKAILLRHIIPCYFDDNNDFHRTGFFPYLQDYLYDDYFHHAVENLIAHPPKAAAAAAAPAPAPTPQEQIAQYWRNINPHNSTSMTAAGPVNLAKVTCGRRTYGDLHVIGYGREAEGLTIGSFCSIAGSVKFMLGGNHPYKGFSSFPFLVHYFGVQLESVTKGPIVLEDDVWIGYDTLVLSGVTIGRGAVIAAGSVVTRDIPPYSIAGGNPARVIKQRFPQEVIDKLCKVDYSRLSDDAILRNREILYQELTAENADAILAKLFG